MINRQLSILVVIAAGWLAAVPSLFAQEADRYETVSIEQLLAVQADVKVWTAQTIAFRENAENLTARELVAQANAIRVKFDPVMILMATTEPAEEYQLAATLLLMGTKGVELSLWHYILAAAANAKNAMEHGDTLLQTAVNQLNDAEKLFAR